jgi:DNA-binding NtrC family response regulator
MDGDKKRNIEPRISEPEIRNKVFLIVDDEPDMCWALEHLLKKKGISSRRALSGQEALKLMESNRFALAFLDAKLPDMEGIELAKRIREIDPAVGIVIISGYYYEEDEIIQKAISDGSILGFIDKPFDHDQIFKAIGEVGFV